MCLLLPLVAQEESTEVDVQLCEVVGWRRLLSPRLLLHKFQISSSRLLMFCLQHPIFSHSLGHYKKKEQVVLADASQPLTITGSVASSGAGRVGMLRSFLPSRSDSHTQLLLVILLNMIWHCCNSFSWGWIRKQHIRWWQIYSKGNISTATLLL